MRVVGYLRVSTDRQAEEGNGLDVQERAVRRVVADGRHRLVALYTDAGISGARPADERPGLTEALLALRERRADVLVVRDLDVLTRDVVDSVLIR